ncbi:MAG TPA: MoaD/ThiS family protein [Thermoguttaceae bacterium]|nr:MoaD/ThiS family protein [Thermoguttaceae bacterium]
MKIRLMISGRNYDVADALPEELALPDGASIDDALQHVAGLLPRDRQLPDSCLLAVSGTHLGTLRNHKPHALRDGDELVVIAPVAGG